MLSLAALVIVSITAPLVLRTCFRGGKDFQGRPGQDKTLKTLVEGSPAEVEKLLDEEKISSSLAQLQKLDLPREKRRRITNESWKKAVYPEGKWVWFKNFPLLDKGSPLSSVRERF